MSAEPAVERNSAPLPWRAGSSATASALEGSAGKERRARAGCTSPARPSTGGACSLSTFELLIATSESLMIGTSESVAGAGGVGAETIPIVEVPNDPIPRCDCAEVARRIVGDAYEEADIVEKEIVNQEDE